MCLSPYRCFTGQSANKPVRAGVALSASAAAENNSAVVHESADLLYHLLVLWAACDIEPDAVYAELRARETQSGVEEKAAR